MPRKQPPSKTQTVYQIRWVNPNWKNPNPKSRIFLKEDAAMDEFNAMVRTGLRVELWQTTHAVKLVQTMAVSYDENRRSAHLAKRSLERA
jgi:hypothetical protein